MKYHRKTFPSKENQKRLIKKAMDDRAYILGNIPITGRSLQNYSIQLFPDMKTSEIQGYMKDKDYLDIACGINHMYTSSLLCSLINNKSKHGLDIHDNQSTNSDVKYYKGSIYKTHFKNESYDCITVNNFLYLWETNPEKLVKIYKELFRICKKGGHIRVFPVFFGNYSEDNLDLFSYINTHFKTRLLSPVKDFSKEKPIYLDDTQTIKQTDNGQVEYKLNHELMSHCLYLETL